MNDSVQDALFREMLSQVSHDNYQPHADGAGPQFTRAHDTGLTVTLRVKPDRRSVITRAHAGLERRSRA